MEKYFKQGVSPVLHKNLSRRKIMTSVELLSESGIQLSNGEHITDGPILECVRKVKDFYERKCDQEYFDYVFECDKALSDKDCGIFLNTVIDDKFGITVMAHMIDVDERVNEDYYYGDEDDKTPAQALYNEGISLDVYMELFGGSEIIKKAKAVGAKAIRRIKRRRFLEPLSLGSLQRSSWNFINNINR